MSSVLIVDDEPAMREILRRWLVPAGYDTREAPDAETAVDTVPPTVSLQGSVVEYLVKPVEPGRLLAAVSPAVEWHQAALARGPEQTTTTDPIEKWLSGGRSQFHAPNTERERDPK